MIIKPLSIEQDYQDETTRIWFNVDGEAFAIADSCGELSLIDSEGHPVDDCNDHDRVKDALIPLYKKYSDEYCGQDSIIDEE